MVREKKLRCAEAEHIADARVRFFRIEAEASRWREQLSLVGAEFGRTIRHFRKMGDTWSVLGDRCARNQEELPGSTVADYARRGKEAYARKRAADYYRLANSTDQTRLEIARKCGTLTEWAEFDSGTPIDLAGCGSNSLQTQISLNGDWQTIQGQAQ